jgi:hypothetical protein
MTIEEHLMTDNTEERLAVLRARMEEHTDAEHEFNEAEMELFYVPQPNLAGHTALVLGKLLFYVEAWRSFLEADISILKPSAANARLLPVRLMAETLTGRIRRFLQGERGIPPRQDHLSSPPYDSEEAAVTRIRREDKLCR